MVEASMKGILVGFVFLIIGVALLGSMANETTRVTQQNTVTNEQITLVNQTAVNLDNRQLDSLTSVVNATNATDILVLNTDYTQDLSAGTVTSQGPAGVFNATYVYREVGNSTARTLTTLVILFFVLFLLLTTVGFFVPGLMDMFRKQ